MNQGTAPIPEYAGFEPGAEEASQVNWTFVNLRAGRIGQTSNEPRDGFQEHRNINQAGKTFTFYAKTFDHLTGFVEDIHWHAHKLQDGTVLTGWNIRIDCGEKGVFVLGVNSNDRPFGQLMNCLINVDFSKTVRFIGFWGKNKTNDRPQKVLLLSQGLDPETGKPIWIKPAHEQKWLSRLLIQKLKEKVPLTEQEEGNVSRLADGSFNKNYPYIVQNADGKWSFDTWNNFLHEQMEEFVIPSVKHEAERRASMTPSPVVPDTDIPDIPDELISQPVAAADDDDIPF